MMVEDDVDGLLSGLSEGLLCQQPGRFRPLSVLLAKSTRWGIGLRIDAAIPYSGRIGLIHWLVAPYDNAYPGIVEDCNCAHVLEVFGTSDATLHLAPLGRDAPLVCERAKRRNLVSGDHLMGLRGWDIPHDRHTVVTDIYTGEADITGNDPSRRWRSWWKIDIFIKQNSASLIARDGSIYAA